jgi:hypothetical protein
MLIAERSSQDLACCFARGESAVEYASAFAEFVVSHHFHLLPEFAGEDVLRYERVDTAHDVHNLSHAEAHRDAAQA